MQGYKINILGTDYTIETHKISEDETMKENGLSGYCDDDNKLIVVADMTEKEYVNLDKKTQEIYRKKTLRHEIIHAFLSESGLSDNSIPFSEAWAKNEEMVDWFALQSPKIFNIFTQLNLF